MKKTTKKSEGGGPPRRVKNSIFLIKCPLFLEGDYIGKKPKT